MHAASVHPEPGSNSRKNSIISDPSISYNLFELFILASFTSLSIYNSLTRSAHTHFFMLCTSLLLFNFQWPFASRSCGQLDYYITSFFPCQYLFWNFLTFFQKSFLRVQNVISFFLPFWGKLNHFITFLMLCQVFFEFFHKKTKNSRSLSLPRILVGHQGLEPRTDRLWAGCSNQLS